MLNAFIRPILWITFVLLVAIGMHFLLIMLDNTSTHRNANAQPEGPAPTIAQPQPTVPAPPQSVTPPAPVPEPATPVKPPTTDPANTLGRINIARWRMILANHGFSFTPNAPDQPADELYQVWHWKRQKRTACKLYIKLNRKNNGDVVRLRFLLESPDTAKGVDAVEDARLAQAAVAAVLKSADAAFAKDFLPVLYSRWWDDAVARKIGRHVGFGRTRGSYTAIHVKDKQKQDPAMFEIMWTDEIKDRTVQFIKDCADVDWKSSKFIKDPK